MPQIRYLHKTRQGIPSIYSQKSGDILQNMNFSRCYRNRGKVIYGFDPNIMGIIVRSKSEVIIATALYDNNIKFEYEKAIKISDVIYYPDFTVEKKNGDIILWEHLGLIDNPDYRNKVYRKIMKYNENGYYQGKNLILTYETAESPLDPMDVEHEIEKMCR